MRRVAIVSLSMSLVACGARYRTETLGTGTAVAVAAEGSVTGAPGAGGVTVPAPGLHEVRWTIAVPRAMEVRWTVACGGGDAVAGVAGETSEAYTARRLAELRAARDRERAAVASLTGAVLGGVGASAGASTPAGEARAEVAVDGQAAGDAVAAAVVSDEVALPPGDVGAGTYRGRVEVVAAGAGACTMTLADADGATGTFEVIRRVDLAAERRAARAEVRAAAGAARAQVAATLVAYGADPGRRVRAAAEAQARVDAEAQARLEVEWRARAEAEAELRIEAEARARLWAAAVDVRGAQLAYLAGVCGADPGHRARVAAARLRAEADARAEAARRVRVARQLEEDRRYQVALAVRADVVAYLEWLGARPRPPMPPPLDEQYGEPPVADAVWVAGEWVWRGGAWVWLDGGWSVALDVGGDARPTVVDHRDGGGAGGHAGRARVEDHRDAPTPTPTHDERPRTRDHRDDGTQAPTRKDDERPRTRDHRDDASDDGRDDDGRVRRRDHR